jgi:hypothetical protein
MAMTERKLKEIDWAPGLIVEGRLIRAAKVKYSDGVGMRYLLKGRDGALLSFKGSTRLDMLLGVEDVGKMVEITYVGLDATRELKAGMSAPKVFRVAVDETSALPVSAGTITDDDIPF